MHRKYLELKAKRDAQLAAANAAIEADDGAAYEAALKEIEALNGQLEKISKLLDEKNRFVDLQKGPQLTTGYAGEDDPDEQDRSKRLNALITSDEYKQQFFKALRAGISPKSYNAEYKALYKAMTISGGDPVGSEGGFLVPPDFQTRVIELAREMVDLSAYAHVETVNSPIGWRVVETSAARTRMSAVGEGHPIPKGEGPRFKRIDFSCKSYGDRIPVSGELMENSEALMEYLAKWFAAKYVATLNGLILDKLNTLEFKAIAGATDEEKIKAIKRAMNKDLRTAVSKKAIVLTNQNGYDDLDNMSDANGRPYLKPDVSGDFDRLKGRPVVYGDTDQIEDITEGDATYDPLFIGDLSTFISLFVLNGMRMAVTNVGGEAWEQGGYEVRVLCHLDCHVIDETAMIKRGIEQA